MNTAINFRVPLVTSKGVCFFEPADIIRLEAKSNYTHFYFKNHRPILSAKVLKKYELQLEPYGFIRTHRSHLVNRQHIVNTDSRGNIIMQDSSRAEISRRMKKSVMDALKN